MIDRNTLFITLRREDAEYLAEKAAQNLVELSNRIQAQIPWPYPGNSRPQYIPAPGADWYREIESYYRSFSGPKASSMHESIRNRKLIHEYFTGDVIRLLTIAFSFAKIATPLPVDAVLCRFYYTSNIDADFKKGEVYQPKGFFSCTYKEEFIDKWIKKGEQSSQHRHYLLIIFLPRTFPVLSLNKFSNYGDSEGEFILPFNTPLQVKDIDPVKKYVHLTPASDFDPQTRNPYRDMTDADQYKAWTSVIRIDDGPSAKDEAVLREAYTRMCGFDCA